MSDPSKTSAETITAAVAKTSLAHLAEVSGLPYTTLASFRNRGWKSKSWDTAEKALAAARVILSEPEKPEASEGSTEP